MQNNILKVDYLSKNQIAFEQILLLLLMIECRKAMLSSMRGARHNVLDIYLLQVLHEIQQVRHGFQYINLSESHKPVPPSIKNPFAEQYQRFEKPSEEKANPRSSFYSHDNYQKNSEKQAPKQDASPTSSGRSYYELFGLSQNASQAAIKKAYHKLSLQFHPDKNPAGGEAFKVIAHIYEVLSDAEKRKAYDQCGIKKIDTSPLEKLLSESKAQQILKGAQQTAQTNDERAQSRSSRWRDPSEPHVQPQTEKPSHTARRPSP